MLTLRSSLGVLSIFSYIFLEVGILSDYIMNRVVSEYANLRNYKNKDSKQYLA